MFFLAVVDLTWLVVDPHFGAVDCREIYPGWCNLTWVVARGSDIGLTRTVELVDLSWFERGIPEKVQEHVFRDPKMADLLPR